MVGNSGDGSANLDGSRGVPPDEQDTDTSPVLDGVSDAELDAFVGKLRTDKSRTLAPAAQPRSRQEMMGERLHRGRQLVSSVREAVPSHAWYVALGGKASGPHDVEALKPFWERGELGPDSLCWREGFSEWLSLSQVPELAEALVPLPQEKVPSVEDMPAAAGPGVPGFALKGAEGLRALAGSAPAAAPTHEASPSLAATTEQVAGAAMVGSGAVGTQAPGAAQPQPEALAESARAQAPAGGLDAEGGTSVDPVGMHAVLAGDARAGQERSRWRGAVWLTVMGGVVGGVTVAVALGLLGHVDGRALAARLGFREAVGDSATTASERMTPASAVPGTGGPPASVAVGTVVGQGSATGAPDVLSSSSTAIPGVGTPPGSAGEGVAAGSPPGVSGVSAVSGAPSGTPSSGVASGAGLAAGVAASTSSSNAVSDTGAGSSSVSLGAVGIDRGGSVPVLAGPRRGSTGSTTSAPVSPLDSSLTTDSLPSPEQTARPAVPNTALTKRAETPPVNEAAAAAALDAKAAPAANAAPKSDLGPDEDFEKELLDPPADPNPPEGRTVYVPPDPSQPPASLAQSDIFAVVAANKADISACGAEEQTPPSDSGRRVVVRWSILPTGKVDEVVTETPSLKGTPLARCIEAKVRAWTFPRHQEPGGPVRFPFVF
ncbi:GYF domain-containing protein [Pyxidicoccus caerfyrddinensis]|uniref:GYF domain-containing protein n=1 Tax=Pyxidicoccus caerfyrddinensis TaxID=2709663 RepID=UPI0013DBAFE3|nr:GYF domain-containing protein [Pyxidicoccus caerfyrddinensis]